jgi:hypothetical protein
LRARVYKWEEMHQHTLAGGTFNQGVEIKLQGMSVIVSAADGSYYVFVVFPFDEKCELVVCEVLCVQKHCGAVALSVCGEQQHGAAQQCAMAASAAQSVIRAEVEPPSYETKNLKGKMLHGEHPMK